MKVTKKQPEIKNELISIFPAGTIFRLKSKNTLEQDLVEGNLFMKVSDADETTDIDILSQSKSLIVRLGNKFELLHRHGPFLGSIVQEESISLVGGKVETELSQCVPGDIVSFESFPDIKYLIVYDPVDDKGMITLLKLDKNLKVDTMPFGEAVRKVDKQIPCIKMNAEILI